MTVALQPDGNVLIGGDFLTVNGVARPRVARLYGDSVAPSLSVARSNAFVIVSWPVMGLNFHLQESTNLSLPNPGRPLGNLPSPTLAKSPSLFPRPPGKSSFAQVPVEAINEADPEILEGFRLPTSHEWLKAQFFMKKLFSVRTIILAGCLLLQLSTLSFHSRSAAGTWTCPLIPALASMAGERRRGATRRKVIIGGQFTMVKGLARVNVARLNADGSGDSTFNPGIAYDRASSLALQSDGKVLVGGQIFHYVCDDRGCYISTTPSLSGSTPTEAWTAASIPR